MNVFIKGGTAILETSKKKGQDTIRQQVSSIFSTH